MHHAITGLVTVGAFALSLLAPVLATAAPRDSAVTTKRQSVLTPPERRRLDRGEMVVRPMAFQHADGRYVGGVSYQVVDARPEVVLTALSDVANWPEALPRTKSAQLLGSANGVSRVEIVHGNGVGEARYSLMVTRSDDGETIRFWLDPSRPHDVRDLWGFFRVHALPGGRSLVTVGAALDLGAGLARLLFEDRIAALMLHAPGKIRAFVEPRALALASPWR